MRVLLGDARPDVRWALRTVIKEEPGLTVVAEASDSEQLLAEARAQHPDVVVLDWEMPDQPAEELLSQLQALNHGLRVIVLSHRQEAKQAALAAGAEAFVSKASAPDQLLAALRGLARG